MTGGEIPPAWAECATKDRGIATAQYSRFRFSASRFSRAKTSARRAQAHCSRRVAAPPAQPVSSKTWSPEIAAGGSQTIRISRQGSCGRLRQSLHGAACMNPEYPAARTPGQGGSTKAGHGTWGAKNFFLEMKSTCGRTTRGVEIFACTKQNAAFRRCRSVSHVPGGEKCLRILEEDC